MERKFYRLKAKTYQYRSGNRQKKKFRAALLMLLLLILWQELPEKKSQDIQKQEEKKDGNVESAWNIGYVEGSKELMEKEVVSGIPEATREPEKEKNGEEEQQTAAVLYPSRFFPETYPVLSDIVGVRYLKEDLRQLTYLEEHFYIVNATTKMTEKEFDMEFFLEADFSMEKTEEVQILIYHTHASEAFADSREGETEDTVVGAGALLAQILREKYGYQVLHDTTVFDRKDGKDNRSYAYTDALKHIGQVVKENPSIEVIIDLHRDAGAKRVVTIQGKQVAKVMLFNGLCRNKSGELTYLPNENLKGNLAFSFQMKLIGDEMYPGLMNRIFLKDYRYNMHLKERCLLIELGTQNNTVEEAKNAMEPLADVLAQVLAE